MTSEMRIHFNKRIYRVSHIPCPISWCKDNNNWSGGDCGALCKCAPFLVLTKSQLEFFKSFNKITYLTLLDAGLSFTNYFATRINTPYIQCLFNILTLLQCIMSLYLVFLIRSINRWLKSIRWSVGWLVYLSSFPALPCFYRNTSFHPWDIVKAVLLFVKPAQVIK